jgi:hypothetical protein
MSPVTVERQAEMSLELAKAPVKINFKSSFLSCAPSLMIARDQCLVTLSAASEDGELIGKHAEDFTRLSFLQIITQALVELEKERIVAMRARKEKVEAMIFNSLCVREPHAGSDKYSIVWIVFDRFHFHLVVHSSVPTNIWALLRDRVKKVSGAVVDVRVPLLADSSIADVAAYVLTPSSSKYVTDAAPLITPGFPIKKSLLESRAKKYGSLNDRPAHGREVWEAVVKSEQENAEGFVLELDMGLKEARAAAEREKELDGVTVAAERLVNFVAKPQSLIQIQTMIERKQR